MKTKYGRKFNNILFIWGCVFGKESNAIIAAINSPSANTVILLALRHSSFWWRLTNNSLK